MRLSSSQQCRRSPWERLLSQLPSPPSLSVHTDTCMHKRAYTHSGLLRGQRGPCPSCFWVQLIVSTAFSHPALLTPLGSLVKWGGWLRHLQLSSSYAHSRPRGLALESSVGTSWRLDPSATLPDVCHLERAQVYSGIMWVPSTPESKEQGTEVVCPYHSTEMPRRPGRNVRIVARVGHT